MDEEGSIEELRRRLYAREGPKSVRRTALGERRETIAREWPESARPARPMFSVKFLKRLLLLTAVFFLLAAGLAAAVLYRGDNFVSGGNIDIKVSGPQAVRAGEEVALQITIENKNVTPLSFVDLVVEYPPGVKRAVKPAEDLKRERFALGTLRSGQIVRETSRSLFFGEKDAIRSVEVRVEYRVADSNAIFDKTTSFPITISASPLVLNLIVPTEINVDQDLALLVEVSSNADRELADALLIAHWPAGFTIKRADPAPTEGQNIWSLGKLRPGEKKRFRITGVLAGQAQEEKAFRFATGIGFDEREGELSAIYSSQLAIVRLNRPQIALLASINGSSENEVVTASGELLRVDIEWTNNLAEELVDNEVTVALAGEVINPSSIAPASGFYQSQTNTIVWNKTTNAALARLAPAARGRVSFTFSTRSLIGREGVIKRPEVNLAIAFRGLRASDALRQNPLESETARTVRVNSVAQLAGKVVQRTSPLGNLGPLPPKVGQETTYTIVFSVVNSSIDLEEAVVRATLPPYVRWLGLQTPPAEELVFNASEGGGGEIVWRLGRLGAGTGLNTSPREVAFNVGFTPSVSQVGTTPLLVANPSLTGIDTFTQQNISAALRRELNINLSADPAARPGDDEVVP